MGTITKEVSAFQWGLPYLVWAVAAGLGLDAAGARTTRLCAHATRLGELEWLKWLREHGWPWDEDTCTEAVRGGHRELLL
jgi:apolipoprotein N-acyltransferase